MVFIVMLTVAAGLSILLTCLKIFKNHGDNHDKNPAIISTVQLTMIIVIGVFVVLPALLIKSNTVDSFIYKRIPHQITYGFILPSFYYVSNRRKIVKYYKKKFWQNAPQILDNFNPNALSNLNRE